MDEIGLKFTVIVNACAIIVNGVYLQMEVV